MSRRPSPKRVASVLVKAGIEQSKANPGFEGGVTRGFYARYGDFGVTVTWSHAPGAAAAISDTRAALARCAEVLEAAGWDVQVRAHDLIVTAAGESR